MIDNAIHVRHVKALESRSQLLDAALASADEANRRWEECRALVDQLRIENAALRAALSQAQMMSGGNGGNLPPQPPPAPTHQHHSGPNPNGSNENGNANGPQNDGSEKHSGKKE